MNKFVEVVARYSLVGFCLLSVNTFANEEENILLSKWETELEMPPFEDILVTDYIPAFDAAAAMQNDKIEGIIANPEAPTFANTIEPYERSRSELYRVLRAFLPIAQSMRDDAVNEASEYIFPAFAAHEEAIFLDKRIFDRVHTIYETRFERDLEDDQIRLVDLIHQEFLKYGVSVEDENKARVEVVSGRIAELQQKFDKNASEEAEAFEYLVTNQASLGGLAHSLVTAARERAKERGHDCECWSFGLSRSLFDQIMASSPDRELRKAIYEGMMGLGGNDNQWNNEEILNELLQLRAERAGLMGYDNFAQYRTRYVMAETPGNVESLLADLEGPLLKEIEDEAEMISKAMKDDGVDGELQPWDWDYYAEKVRSSEYSVDSDRVREYFTLENVVKGSFEVASRLFGVEFVERDDLPRWYPDQRVFEVVNKEGDHVGVLMADFYAREGKRGGGWTDEIRVAESMDRPLSGIAGVNFNLTKPAEGEETLLTQREGEIVLHELGHAMQTILSTQRYVRLSGFNYLPRDGAEYPSQVLEFWFNVPEVIKSIGRHYETGEPIPDDLIEKLSGASKFNQARQKVNLIELSRIDLALHGAGAGEAIDSVKIANEIRSKSKVAGYVGERYGLMNFRHMVSLGYDAQFYGYLWADVIAADAFGRFEEDGFFDEEAAEELKRLVFEAGASLPQLDGFIEFRGRDPDPGAFVRSVAN
jgi:peptidyl-dipeptidase Dcp